MGARRGHKIDFFPGCWKLQLHLCWAVDRLGDIAGLFPRSSPALNHHSSTVPTFPLLLFPRGQMHTVWYLRQHSENLSIVAKRSLLVLIATRGWGRWRRVYHVACPEPSMLTWCSQMWWRMPFYCQHWIANLALFLAWDGAILFFASGNKNVLA